MLEGKLVNSYLNYSVLPNKEDCKRQTFKDRFPELHAWGSEGQAAVTAEILSH